MDISANKTLVLAFTFLTTIFLLRYYWIQNNIKEITRSQNTDKKQVNQKKFFTLLISDNHRLKTVYIDNDNTEYTSDLLAGKHTTNGPSDSNLTIAGSSYYYDTSTGEIESPNSIEWDETIDYNYNENPETKRTCSNEEPSRTVVLIQSRYHDNETFPNIMYRYGDFHELAFALPKRPNFQSYWPLRFHPSFVDSSLIFTNRVHMLINPPYMFSTMKRYMSKDAVFIAVIYDPVKVYLSNMVRRLSLNKYPVKTRLNKINTLFKKGKVLKDNYANTIAFGLGYSSRRSRSKLVLEEFISNLENQFDFILIGDYLDESLVILKNMLCWSLNDFVYINRKDDGLYNDISNDLKVKIKMRNKIDQVIYKHFNQTFWEKVKSYGATFTSDLQNLQNLKANITRDCSTRNDKLSESQKTLGNKENIDSMCKRLRWCEREYVSYLKEKLPSVEDNDFKKGLQYLEDSLSVFFNTTSKEISRLELL